MSKLQAQMRARLAGGQFRHLNELLYTHSGGDSYAMMQKDPALFEAYHSGFRSQTEGWPSNPLDVMISEIRRTAANKTDPATYVVADFGCGEARLAATLMGKNPGAASSGKVASPAKFKVHSFDLVAPPGNSLITACDMSRVPLGSACADAAVYCLSLMGTNYMDFLSEGARVLKPGGRLLIAEVRSRFASESPAEEVAEDKPRGGQAPGKHAGNKRPREEPQKSKAAAAPPSSGSGGLDAFIGAVKRLGFTLEARNDSNRMFITLFFRKAAATTESAAEGGSAKAAGAATASASSSGIVYRTNQATAAAAAAGPGAFGAQKKKHKNNGSHGDGHAGSGAVESAASTGPAPVLKACIYKRR